MNLWLQAHAGKAISARLTERYRKTSSRNRFNEFRHTVLLDVNPSTSRFLSVGRVTLHSFYTVAAARIGPSVRTRERAQRSEPRELRCGKTAGKKTRASAAKRGVRGAKSLGSKLDDDRCLEDRIQLVLPRVRRAEYELRPAG